MASTLPPVKGAAFTFDMALMSQTSPYIIKTSPTLAAGDITVSLDGGNFANITTLPTQIQTTGVLPVALSTDEMNADLVVVLFHDAAGDEWQDAVVTIYTVAQTLNTTDAAVDAVKVDTAAILLDTGTDGVVVTPVSKTGYALAATGLDAISTTAPAGVASTFREMMVQLWRRAFHKATMTATQLKTYADDGTTVLTTQTVADDGTTQTQGAAT